MGQENDQIAPRTLNLSFITCYLLSPMKSVVRGKKTKNAKHTQKKQKKKTNKKTTNIIIVFNCKNHVMFYSPLAEYTYLQGDDSRSASDLPVHIRLQAHFRMPKIPNNWLNLRSRVISLLSRTDCSWYYYYYYYYYYYLSSSATGSVLFKQSLSRCEIDSKGDN